MKAIALTEVATKDDLRKTVKVMVFMFEVYAIGKLIRDHHWRNEVLELRERVAALEKNTDKVEDEDEFFEE